MYIIYEKYTELLLLGGGGGEIVVVAQSLMVALKQ